MLDLIQLFAGSRADLHSRRLLAPSSTWDDAAMARLRVVEEELAAAGRLGPVARLLPTTSATTVGKGHEPVVMDGPFAETKEQLLGFFVVDCSTLEEALGSCQPENRRREVAGGP